MKTNNFAMLTGSLILTLFLFVSGKSQTPAPALQKLTGLIRVPKAMGVVPMGPGHSQPAVYPCAPFYVAVLDPDDRRNKTVAVTDGLLQQGRDDGDYYTCKYELKVPTGKRLFAVAGMGGTLLLPREDRSPMYIKDAWIGGARSKVPFGHERGFAGKYVTVGKKATWLTFELVYARVDPN